jgi:hypothetical protein
MANGTHGNAAHHIHRIREAASSIPSMAGSVTSGVRLVAVSLSIRRSSAMAIAGGTPHRQSLLHLAAKTRLIARRQKLFLEEVAPLC